MAPALFVRAIEQKDLETALAIANLDPISNCYLVSKLEKILVELELKECFEDIVFESSSGLDWNPINLSSVLDPPSRI